MKYTRCEQHRHDCFACDENGFCVALRDTKFKDFHGRTKKCPFFKTVMQAGINAEIIKQGDYKNED